MGFDVKFSSNILKEASLQFKKSDMQKAVQFSTNGGTASVTMTTGDAEVTSEDYQQNIIVNGGTTPGQDGGYYTPSVDDSGILTWEASKAGMPAVSAANVKGKDGYTPIKGKDYFDGEPGKTPVKGTDYFTATDKAEMVAAVIAALPVYGGETA